MKTTSFVLATSLWSFASAATIASVPATLTQLDVEDALATGSATSEINLEKRKNDPAVDQETLAAPKPWLRTRILPSTTVTELVTPTVWGGVTFSASPRSHPKTPFPWLSLDKEGKVKTISPKLKHGVTQNGPPEYGTWFEDAVTETVNLKTIIDGVTEDTPHEVVTHVPEDITERQLNPIIRCTPDRYFDKLRKNKKIPSEPFCTPKEGSSLLFENTYWVSWYTKYFPGAERVRLHLAYIHLNKYGKVAKRDFIPDDEDDSALYKRDADDAFWSSEWLPNLDGVYPLDITLDMFGNSPVQDIMLTIQPDYVQDQDFNLVNGTHLKILKKSIKGSGKTATRLRVEDEGESESALYIALSIPTVLVVVFCGFMIFNFLVRNSRTWQKIRIKSRKTGKVFNRNSKYSKLPSTTYELDRMD